MYVAENMERMEYRRIRRAAVRKQQAARKRLFLIFCLTIIVMFGIGVGFGTLLTRAEEPAQEPSYKYYANIEIQRGDTLWGIAEEYMDSVHYADKMEYMDELMTLNHMSDDHLISGQKILVPYYSSDLK